jgi:hypothetical protein
MSITSITMKCDADECTAVHNPIKDYTENWVKKSVNLSPAMMIILDYCPNHAYKVGL